MRLHAAWSVNIFQKSHNQLIVHKQEVGHMPITRNINLLRIKVSKTINWIIELEMMPFHYEPNENIDESV